MLTLIVNMSYNQLLLEFNYFSIVYRLDTRG